MPGALDQIVQRFGTDIVAEVTGRSRRIVRKGDRLDASRTGRLGQSRRDRRRSWMTRSASWSSRDAGGTGRSYHADLVGPEPAPARPLSA